MSEEKDKHTDIEKMFEAKTNTFFNTNLDMLKSDSTSPRFVSNNISPSNIIVPSTHAVNQNHLIDNEKNHLKFFNSTIAQQFDFKITSNGTVITGSLERTGGGDLTLRFDGEYFDLDCTPALTVTITAGTDTVPIHKHYYILQSTPTIITEGNDWPTVEHIKISKLNIPSAVRVQTKNVYSNQNINNMNAFVAGDLSGMLAHLGHKIRESVGATYPQEGGGLAGAAGGGEYLDVSGGVTVRFKMDVGVIMQMHDHTFNAVDTSAGDDVLVRNFSGTAWNAISNIYDIVNDNLGASINNRYFNLIVIAIASKEKDFVMINTPGGSYAVDTQAFEDKDGFDDLTIPIEFKGVATLVCRMTIRKAASAWVVHQIDDLRGITPASITGSTISGGYSDVDAIAAVEAAGLSLATTKVITSADEELVFTFGKLGVGFNSAFANRMILAHRALNNDNDYAISQSVVGDTYFNIKTGRTGWFLVNSSSGIFNYNASGLQMGISNARINEFSTDGTMAGNSDVAVPTEKAVKTYVDGSKRTWMILNIQVTDGAVFTGGNAAMLLFMPNNDTNASFRANFLVHPDLPSPTTLTLKIVYSITDANAWSGLWSIECLTTGATYISFANNVLSADSSNDFPGGTANEIFIKSIVLDDASIVAGGVLGVRFISDALNAGDLFIWAMYIEET